MSGQDLNDPAQHGASARAASPNDASTHAASTKKTVAEPSRFNVSRWALEHKALTRYLMVALMVLGFAAYFQLGQD
ncbi:MAG: putative transrane drug efflux protein, partial [Rhizobacter sp.]|nr:putative transrane drug efflux protein [Rhizobacter sp.]